jgi:hypothetical protein
MGLLALDSGLKFAKIQIFSKSCKKSSPLLQKIFNLAIARLLSKEFYFGIYA